MRQQLTEEERHALVVYRLERAHETMKEIPSHIESGYYATAINRLYYACYYVAVALLVSEGLQTATYNGVKTLLGLHFVHTGKLENRHGKTFSTLYDLRQSGDYDDFVYCDKEMADEYYPKAQAFLEAVEELIYNSESKWHPNG